MKDRWIKCISSSGTLRGVGIRATDIVKELSHLQALSIDASLALGEALMGGILLSSFCKQGERVNLNVQGNGIAKQALVDAYPDGQVRGYVIENPNAVYGDRGPWGEGLMSVLRTKDLEKQQPYIGTVPLVTGHLAKDLTFYWLQSEQVPSAVGLVVNRKDGKITSAGGFLVQALPGASVEEIRSVENHIVHLSNLAAEVELDRDPIHLLSQIFQDTAFLLLEERDLTRTCNCSHERVLRALSLIGKEEIQSIIDTEGQTSVKCDFCMTEYTADRTALESLLGS